MREMNTKACRKWANGPFFGFCLIWLCSADVTAVNAQSAPETTQSSGNLRLLSGPEGKAIASAALEQNQVPNGTQDCSHVVHEIYLNAGFEYPYASSFDLYAGTENFERVKHPQPGDLIAWPGHVGIVLEPSEHSFYSLVSTGLEAQNYDGAYWKSRGRPRFYRFKVENAGVRTAANAPASHRPPKSGMEQRSIGYGLPAPSASAVAGNAPEVPQSIVLSSGNKQPTKEEVAQGISELSNASGSVLLADAPSKLMVPVVIFERLQVERLEIKRGHGWAHLQIDSRATLAGGQTDYTRRREQVRWELHRTESGWEAIAPTDRTYMPQDVAVRNLAAQLARLTDGDSTAAHREAVLRQELELANLLSGLLEKK
jgi:hypothetical protein